MCRAVLFASKEIFGGRSWSRATFAEFTKNAMVVISTYAGSVFR
jgi:hypothetical protein